MAGTATSPKVSAHELTAEEDVAPGEPVRYFILFYFICIPFNLDKFHYRMKH